MIKNSKTNFNSFNSRIHFWDQHVTDTSTSCILYSSSRREESLNPQWVKYHFFIPLNPIAISLLWYFLYPHAPSLHLNFILLSSHIQADALLNVFIPLLIFFFFTRTSRVFPLLCVLSPSSSHVHPGKRALRPSPLCLLSTPISSACLVFDGACSLPSPPHANAGPLGDPPTHQPARCWQETHAGGAVPSGRRPAVNRERWGGKKTVCVCVY